MADDDYLMRMRLQQVAAYRHLCQLVRSSGRGNVFFALFMLALAYLTVPPGGGRVAMFVFALYVGLAMAELAIGLFKWVHPCAEGILLDALILFLFAGWNLGWQGLRLLAGAQPQLFIALIGAYLLYGSLKRFRDYQQIRKLFAQRPTTEQIHWFNDLIREIRTADPETDDQALDLPTRPRWKAKLLGTTAFFVASNGGVVVAGLGDFEIVRETDEAGIAQPRALLRLHDQVYPEFTISDATWGNYLKWLATHPTSISPSPLT